MKSVVHILTYAFLCFAALSGSAFVSAEAQAQACPNGVCPP